MNVKLATAVAALMLTTGAAFAQDQGPPPGAGGGPMPASPRMMEACGADLQTMCPAAQTPKDRRVCLKENQARLSPACSGFLAERRQAHMQKMQEQQQMQGPQGAQPMQGPPGSEPPSGPPPASAPAGAPPGY